MSVHSLEMNESLVTGEPTPSDDVKISSNIKPNTSNKSNLKALFCSLKFWKVCLYGFMIAISSQMFGVVIPTLAKDYFDENSGDGDCHSSQSKSAFYSSIFDSLGGVIGILFEGYIGHLSDVYGRKKVMCFTWSTMALQMFAYGITKNIWVYFVGASIAGLAGTFGGMPTVINAALADITPVNDRTIVFSVLFGIAGVVVLLSVLLCEVVINIFGTFGAIYAGCISMILTGLFLVLFVPETLDKELRSELKSSEIVNPFKSLLKIRDNKVIFWFCIVALFTSLPDAGVNSIISSYLSDVLSLCNDDQKATMFNGIGLITLAISMLLSQLFLMPMMIKCCKVSDIGLFMFGLIVLAILLASGIIIYFFPTPILGILMWFAFGCTYILVPITNGSLSKRLSDKEQGIGIGCLHAIKGLTYAISPITFGILYNTFEKDSWLKTMPFIASMIFIFFGFAVVMVPLRLTVNHYDNCKKITTNLQNNNE